MSTTQHSLRRRARARSLPARIEALEPRTLFSISTFQIDFMGADNAAATDNAGHLFVTNDNGDIDFISKNSDGTLNITPHATGGDPNDIVYDGHNGHLYFTDFSTGGIGEMDASGTVVHTYTINPDLSEPVSIAVATDGSVWFSTPSTANADNTASTSYLGRIATDGTMTQTLVPFTQQNASLLAAGSDGSMWVLENGGIYASGAADSKISKVTFSGDSFSFSTFDIPTAQPLITGFTAAADGSLWIGISEDFGAPTVRPDMPDQLQHITFDSSDSPTFTSYIIPTASGEHFLNPYGLTVDSTGKVWFSEAFAEKISYLNPADGTFTRETIPNAAMGSISRMAIINGSSGPADVWFVTGDGLLGDDNLATPPAIAATGNANLSGTAGTAISGPLLGFTSSVDSGFSYSVNYGNGTTASGTLAENSSGSYTIPASVTYAAAGNYAISVTITDGNGDLKTVSGTATITSGSTAPTVTAIALAGPEDKPLANNITGVSTLVVASFTGSPAAYSATINFGDGTSAVGRIVAGSTSGTYYVALQSGTTKTYANSGTYTVTVAISNGSTTTTVSAAATISDTPLVASQNVAISPLFGRIVLNAVATFTDDIDATANMFTATISWGDGKTSTGLVVRNPQVAGQFYVIGLHNYAHSGTYHISTLIKNPSESETATATAVVTV